MTNNLAGLLAALKPPAWPNKSNHCTEPDTIAPCDCPGCKVWVAFLKERAAWKASLPLSMAVLADYLEEHGKLGVALFRDTKGWESDAFALLGPVHKTTVSDNGWEVWSLTNNQYKYPHISVALLGTNNYRDRYCLAWWRWTMFEGWMELDTSEGYYDFKCRDAPPSAVKYAIQAACLQILAKDT